MSFRDTVRKSAAKSAKDAKVRGIRVAGGKMVMDKSRAILSIPRPGVEGGLGISAIRPGVERGLGMPRGKGLEIAKACHLSPSMVTRIFNGERGISIRTARKLALYFNLSVDELIQKMERGV